jgi:sortase B
VINKNNEPGFAEAIAQPAPVEKPPLTPTRKVKIKDNSTLYEQSKFKQIKEGLGNDDVIGYLKIDGTTIDYPVLQSSDNKYYLNRDEYGQASAAGSIFLDYENDIRRSDKNTIIYGHNMNKDYMFHSLRYYNDYDYYLKHKYITFDTLYANQTWEIFSFYKTDISFNYIKVFFSSQEEFIDLLSEMKSRSVYDTGVDVAPDDLVLTLSTCSNQETDTRFVVNAKLVSQTLYTPLSQN